MDMEKIRIIGCPCLAGRSKEEVKDHIIDLYRHKVGGYSVAINAEKVVMYNRSKEIRELIENSALPTIDGEGVSWAIKLIYGKTTSKVDLPVTALELADKNQLRVFFLGSKEEYNRRAVENVIIKYPGIIIAGRHDGYFNDSTIIRSKLMETEPDMVFVALGSPRQELLARDLVPFLTKTLFICCGGAINVLAGIRKRPPAFIISNRYLPLEWLYVLLTDPSITRLKRQSALPLFFILMLRDIMRIRIFSKLFNLNLVDSINVHKA